VSHDTSAVIEQPGTTPGGRRSRAALVGTFGTATALVFSQATSAIALLFLARRSEPESFGSYIGLYAASLSVGALLDFGSSQYRTRELARGQERTSFRWWLRRRSLMQVPVVVVFGVVSVLLLGDRLPVLCTVGLVAQALTYNVSQGSLSAVRATRSPVMAEWFVGLGNLVLLVICLVGPSSVLLAAAGLGAAASWFATAVIGLVATRHLVGGHEPAAVRNPWSGSASFGISSFSTSIQGFSIGAIGWTSGADQAALIGSVNKWGQPIGLFAAAYASYMFPAFSSAPTDRAAFDMLRPLRVIAGLGTLLAVALMVISPWLVDTLLGDEYAGADTILRLLLLAAIPVLVAQPLTSLLQARGAERFVARLFVAVNVAVFTLAVVGSFALGAASIPVFSFLGSCVLLVVLGRRALAMRARHPSPASNPDA
jgi:O-antigen/teichoic acid export membrane protein